MKAIFLSFSLILSVFSTNALNPDSGDPSEILTSELTEIIGKSAIWNSLERGTKMLVSFTINNEGELVILSTDNPEMDSIIKGLLNYKKINVSKKLYNKIFHLPIKVEKEV